MPSISINIASDLGLGLALALGSGSGSRSGSHLDLALNLGERNLSSLSQSPPARPCKRERCYSSGSAAALASANYCTAFPADQIDASLWACPTTTTTATHVTTTPSHSCSSSALRPSASKARGLSPSATVYAVAGNTSTTRQGGLGKHPRSSPSPSMSAHHDGFNPHTAADLLRQAMFSR